MVKQTFELLRLQKQVFDKPRKLGTPSERKLVPTIALKFASTKELGGYTDLIIEF